MLKTLVIATPGFPKDEADSTCIPDRQIFVRVLKEQYPELNIIVLSFQYPYKAATYQWNGIKVMALGGQNRDGLYRRYTWLRAWRALKKIRRENKVIGLLSFWLDECAYIADKFATRYALKHYCWLLGQDARPGNKYVHRMRPDGWDLIALSDQLANQFKKNYDITPAYVIPGAIDPSIFKPAPAKRDIAILGVGSLIPLKQWHLFIETVKFIKEYLPDVNATICGKGPELDRLKQLANTYDLTDNITFKGELSHPEVLEHMQHSKILLHPSNYEGFSTVLLEGLYAGAHVVSFFRPMEEAFPHHHIVSNNDEMDHKVLSLLMDTTLDHEPVLINDMKQVAARVMALFDRRTL